LPEWKVPDLSQLDTHDEQGRKFYVLTHQDGAMYFADATTMLIYTEEDSGCTRPVGKLAVADRETPSAGLNRGMDRMNLVGGRSVTPRGRVQEDPELNRCRQIRMELEEADETAAPMTAKDYEFRQEQELEDASKKAKDKILLAAARDKTLASRGVTGVATHTAKISVLGKNVGIRKKSIAKSVLAIRGKGLALDPGAVKQLYAVRAVLCVSAVSAAHSVVLCRLSDRQELRRYGRFAQGHDHRHAQVRAGRA
jgi:hypothetical protein